MEEVKKLLNTLADYQSQKDVMSMDKQALIDSVLTKEIKDKIAEIEAEFVGKSEAVDRNIASITEEVKDKVKLFGETVRGDFLMAVWNKGRVSWDTKELDKAIKLIPALAEYKHEGEPSISIRKL
jgi:phage host-nuclease inhibitor protein Gam